MRATCLALCLVSCAGGAPAPARSPEQAARMCLSVARVEAEFTTELVEVCGKHEGVVDVEADCPEFSAIDAKYKPEREAAMRQCKQ